MANDFQDAVDREVQDLVRRCGMKNILESLIKNVNDERAAAEAPYLQTLSFDLNNALRHYNERDTPMSATG